MAELIGIDLGGTKILARFVDPETGASRGRVKRPTPHTGPKDVLKKVAEVVDELDPHGRADAVGIGVAGLVTDEGVVTLCPNIGGWDSPINVAKILTKKLKRTVAVGNDVNVGALAEHRVGAGKGFKDMAAVFVGTGVGGGLVLNNRLIAGARGMAGEIGHVTTHPGGRPCGCGQLGHMEAYAGRAGIEAEARRRHTAGYRSELINLAGTGPIRSSFIARAIHDNDPVTLDLIEDAVQALAMAIGSMATLLDLPLVVLGGGVVDRLGQDFIYRIHTSPAFGGFGSQVVELRLAERIDDAGVVGAAILAADATDSKQRSKSKKKKQ
ncbi:MAG: ROK family protein [Acidimicrobiia bacterium]|nr:ROK family protein [Acidimicrobiia bacterium]